MIDHIRESNLIEGIDDPKEDKQSMRAWEWLMQQEEIGRAELLHLHKLIVKNQKDLSPGQKGNYRYIQVWVGGHQPPNALKVPELMENWLFDLKMNVTYPDKDGSTPKDLHKTFEAIHPFVDGNGRTGRMLMWWHEMKLGKEPTLLLASQRQEYYKWFKPSRAALLSDRKGSDNG